MNYKSMWNKLKTEIKKDLAYHESGAMQSLAESVWGEKKAKEYLKIMEDMEKNILEVIERKEGEENE